jgi:hypothetical protein
MVHGTLRSTGDRDEYPLSSAHEQFVTVLVVPEWATHTFSQAMAILLASAARGFEFPLTVPFVPFTPYDHHGSFDDFDLELEIRGADGALLGTAVSASGDFIDWIHARVPAGAQLTVRVTLHDRWSAVWRVVAPDYRLIVVGSTPHLASTSIGGEHAIPLAR